MVFGRNFYKKDDKFGYMNSGQTNGETERYAVAYTAAACGGL